MREFLWSEDMADACVFVMQNINFNELVGVSPKLGTLTSISVPRSDISIKDLAHLIAGKLHMKGKYILTAQNPMEQWRNLQMWPKLTHWWKHKIEIDEGVRKCAWLV